MTTVGVQDAYFRQSRECAPDPLPSADLANTVAGTRGLRPRWITVEAGFRPVLYDAETTVELNPGVYPLLAALQVWRDATTRKGVPVLEEHWLFPIASDDPFALDVLTIAHQAEQCRRVLDDARRESAYRFERWLRNNDRVWLTGHGLLGSQDRLNLEVVQTLPAEVAWDLCLLIALGRVPRPRTSQETLFPQLDGSWARWLPTVLNVPDDLHLRTEPIGSLSWNQAREAFASDTVLAWIRRGGSTDERRRLTGWLPHVCVEHLMASDIAAGGPVPSTSDHISLAQWVWVNAAHPGTDQSLVYWVLALLPEWLRFLLVRSSSRQPTMFMVLRHSLQPGSYRGDVPASSPA